MYFFQFSQANNAEVVKYSPGEKKKKKGGIYQHTDLGVFLPFFLFSFFFLSVVETPPPPYHAREPPGIHNGRSMDAIAESQLVLSLPNGGKSADGEAESK